MGTFGWDHGSLWKDTHRDAPVFDQGSAMLIEDLQDRGLADWGDARGQAIDATGAKGARPTRSPYRLESVLALMYRHLGIDPAPTFDDPTGRPRSMLEHRERITELEA